MNNPTLKIKYDQDKFKAVFLDAKRPVSFPHEDKNVTNEYHAVRKSHDATQKKCPHVVHFNLPRDWFEANTLLRRRQKNSRVSPSTGKSNNRPLLKRERTEKEYGCFPFV